MLMNSLGSQFVGMRNYLICFVVITAGQQCGRVTAPPAAANSFHKTLPRFAVSLTGGTFVAPLR